MAEWVGIDRSFLADIERDKRSVSILNLSLISEGLGISLLPNVLVPLTIASCNPRVSGRFATIPGMMNLSSVLKQLKQERDKAERHLAGLNVAIAAFTGVYRGKPAPTRRKMSAAAKERIAAAQRARWAKWRKGQKVVSITRKRTMSASARRKIAAAQRARRTRGGRRTKRRDAPE